MTHINPADCKPGEVYVVRLAHRGRTHIARRRSDLVYHPWRAFLDETEGGLSAFYSDAEVTVLHRLVPERGEDTVEDARSEAEREADMVDGLADSIEHITGDPDVGISPRDLRLMARDMRADAEAQAAEDALVEKTAQAMRAAVHDGYSWAELSPTEAAEYRDLARAALAVLREEADQ